MKYILSVVLASLMAAAWTSQAAAAAAAGDVQFASGTASVTRADGSSRPLDRGLELRNGDTVDSGTGRVQLRFTDGALVSLQPESRFRIDDYRFDGKTDGSEKGFFSLLKGGLRTISGWIGRVHRSGYRVDTPTATIGIRGTEYSAVLGNSLTVSVGEGRVAITNDAGEFILDAGRTAYVKDRKTLPVIVSEKPFLPPAGAQPALAAFQPQPYAGGDNLEGEVLTALAALAGSGASFAPGTLPQIPANDASPPVIGGGTLPPVIPPGGGTTPPGGGGTTPPGGGATAGDYVVMAGAAELQSARVNAALLEAGPATALKCGAAGDCAQIDTASFKLNQGSAKTVENGFDGVIGWGRWTAGNYNNTSTAFGNTTLLDTEGLHYVYGGVTSQLPKADLKGNTVGTYSIVGSTMATAVGGGLGLGQFSGTLGANKDVLSVNFTAGTMDLGFEVAFPNGPIYGVSGTGLKATPQFGFSGSPSLTTTGSTGCASACSSTVNGFFAGPNAERAGIGYQIDDPGAKTTVHGAAALKQN